jgi:hypothetical protein
MVKGYGVTRAELSRFCHEDDLPCDRIVVDDKGVTLEGIQVLYPRILPVTFCRPN